MKIGDKIIRIDSGYYNCKPNTIYTIEKITKHNTCVELVEIQGRYMTECFKLYKNPDILPEDLFTI